MELPSSQQVVSKVQQLDDVRHILDKGSWMATPAMDQGWKVFINVIDLFD